MNWRTSTSANWLWPWSPMHWRTSTATQYLWKRKVVYGFAYAAEETNPRNTGGNLGIPMVSQICRRNNSNKYLWKPCVFYDFNKLKTKQIYKYLWKLRVFHGHPYTALPVETKGVPLFRITTFRDIACVVMLLPTERCERSRLLIGRVDLTHLLAGIPKRYCLVSLLWFVICS